MTASVDREERTNGKETAVSVHKHGEGLLRSVLRNVGKSRVRVYGDGFFVVRGRPPIPEVVKVLRELLAHEQVERVPVPHSAEESLLALTPVGTALLAEIDCRLLNRFASRSIRGHDPAPGPARTRHTPANPSGLVNVTAAAVIVDCGRTLVVWDEVVGCWRLPEYVAIGGEPIERGLARQVRGDFAVTVRGLSLRAIVEHAHLDGAHRLRHETALVFEADIDGTVAVSPGCRQVSEVDLPGLDLYPPTLSQYLTHPNNGQRWTRWPGQPMNPTRPLQTGDTGGDPCQGTAAS